MKKIYEGAGKTIVFLIVGLTLAFPAAATEAKKTEIKK